MIHSPKTGKKYLRPYVPPRYRKDLRACHDIVHDVKETWKPIPITTKFYRLAATRTSRRCIGFIDAWLLGFIRITREPETPKHSSVSGALTRCSRIRSSAPNTTPPA